MSVSDLAPRLQRALDGRYRIVREIGRGGMGVVFRADDLKHDRPVALKALDPEAGRSVGRERFLREIRISAHLTHPGVLTLIDSGEADGVLYYVMPLVGGGSLRDRMKAEGMMSVDEALRITREVGETVAYAHRAGVVHRDLKPENVLFEAGHALVADFGVARALEETGGERLTRTGLSIGTTAYASPEQVVGATDVDGRSDQYSLACVLYEMLLGSPPWDAGNPQAMLACKLRDPVPGLRVVRDTIPLGVEAAVVRALSRTPADRFPTMEGFLEALTAGRDTGSTTGRTGDARLRRGAIAAVVASLLIAIGIPVATRMSAGGSAEPVGMVGATFEQLTSEPGIEWFPGISPIDGSIVYAAEGPEGRDLFLRPGDGGGAVNLTAAYPEDDDEPALSPDGRRIAFRSEREGGGLFVLELEGTTVRRVTRVVGEGHNPAWSPDGTRLVYATERIDVNPQNSDGKSQLRIVDLAAGEIRPLPTDVSASLPAWSPGGRRIAFTRRLGAPEAWIDIWTLPADGGESLPVTDDRHTDWDPVWSADGRWIYFASARGGSMNLWRAPVEERSGRALGPPEPVMTPAPSLAHPALSADSRLIVYSGVLTTINIYALRFDPDRGEVLGEPFAVTTGSRRWSSPDPSPDGRTIAMYSLAQPEGEVHLVEADGTALRRITGDSATDRVPRWSPDGRWIAFFSNRGGPLDVWMVRPDGSELKQVSRSGGGVPVWSPDGTRMVATGGTAEEAANRIFDPSLPWDGQEFEPLPPIPPELSTFRANDWSRDGDWLVGGATFGDDGIGVLHLPTGRYERLTSEGQWPVWLPDGRRILYVTGGNEMRVVDRVSRRVRTVFASRRDIIGPPRLTRDGRTMYYSRRVTEADLWVMRLP